MKNINKFLKESLELRLKLSKPGRSRLGRQQVNDVLSQINAYHLTLINNISDVVYFKNIKGQYILVNKTFEELVGLKAAEIIGKSDRQLFPSKLSRQYSKGDREVHKKGKTVRSDEEFTGRDGKMRYFETVKSPVYDDNAKIVGLVGVSREITDYRRIDEELKLFKDLINQSNDAIFVVDPATSHFLDVNNKACSSLGYSLDELLNMRVADIEAIMPDISLWKEHVKEVKANGYMILEGEHRCKDGTKFPVWVNVKFLTHDKKDYMVAIARDITKRKQAEKEIREREEQQRIIIQTSMDSFWLIDTKGRILDVNEAYCSLTGYTRDELLKMSVKDVEGLETSDDVNEHIRKVIEKGFDRFETKHRCKDGRVIDIEVSVNYLPLAGGKFFSFMRDITEREMMEVMLRNEKHDLEKLFNSLGDAVFVIKMPERIIEFVNNSVEPIFGYKPEECIGRFVDFFYPDIKEFQACAGKLDEAVRQGKDVLNIEQSLKRKNGEIFPSGITTTIFKKDGIGTRIISIVRDITELKEAEERKISNQKRLTQEVAETLPGTFCIFDESGHIEGWNKNFQTATGYSAEEISRMHPLDFFAEDDRENMAVKMREILTKGKAQAEAKVVSKEGRITPYFLMGNRICIDDRVCIIGMGVDITEKKRMEQELLGIQKLESLGILAGGIAHDFNNVLTGILGNISLAKMCIDTEDKMSKMLNEAEKACLRAKELSQQLITFAKGGAPIKKTISIAELIKDSTTFTLSGSKVKPEFSIPEDLWPVEVDEGQISQVINNIVLNADQAMPEGGIVEVRCENTIIEEDTVSLKKGRYVNILVKDYGGGIAKENLQKIFDPYFTTKEKGSGLGLSTVYSIVKNHGGYITVESESGKGAIFSVYLPASEKKAVKRVAQEEEYIAGRGRILLMDDEKLLRAVTGEMLMKLGYEVELAEDGAKAVDVYRKAKESGKPFDAVIMDLTIPGGMGGKEAIKKLLKIDPAIKAIVSSGYSDDPIMADYKKYGFKGCIAKPYKMAEVSRIVNEVIRGEEMN